MLIILSVLKKRFSVSIIINLKQIRTALARLNHMGNIAFKKPFYFLATKNAKKVLASGAPNLTILLVKARVAVELLYLKHSIHL